jgi:hypothetical protein
LEYLFGWTTYWRCVSPEQGQGVDLLTGEPHRGFCDLNRRGECGREGKFWEAA